MAQAGVAVRTLTAGIFFDPNDSGLPVFAVSSLALDRNHTSGGEPDSLFDYLSETPNSQSRARSLPIIVWQLDVAAATTGNAAAAQTLLDRQGELDTANQDVIDAEADLAGTDPADLPAVAAAEAAVAAAEAAIGLAILVCFFRNRGTIDVEDVNVMKG